jgi:PP-loop superfamily ATP-utilizing enzyme
MLDRNEFLADTDADAAAAESELRRLGLIHLRVHSCGDLAWLDIAASQAQLIVQEPLRGEVVRAVKGAGFGRVALAIDG